MEIFGTRPKKKTKHLGHLLLIFTNAGWELTKYPFLN